MLTIRTLENIKRGARLTLFNGIFAILLGAFYLIFFVFILKTNFHSIDVVWQIFAKYNPAINLLFVRLIIVKGLFVATLGIVITYLSNYILKKKEKSTWVILFIVGLIFWPSLLTFEILDKNVYTIAMAFFGWVTFIIGMVLPIKYYMQREYNDY